MRDAGFWTMMGGLACRPTKSKALSDARRSRSEYAQTASPRAPEVKLGSLSHISH
jgi:hypothetical protein